MKNWVCDACGMITEVSEEYEPKFCCSGLREQCGCVGLLVNPVFCDECEVRIHDYGRIAND